MTNEESGHPATKKAAEAGIASAALLAKLRDADRVMMEIDKLTQQGKLSSRSPINDARLDYSEPGEYPYLDREKKERSPKEQQWRDFLGSLYPDI